MHVESHLRTAVEERPSQRAGVELAAADERLQVYVLDVENGRIPKIRTKAADQRLPLLAPLVSPYSAGLSFGSLYILNCR